MPINLEDIDLKWIYEDKSIKDPRLVERIIRGDRMKINHFMKLTKGDMLTIITYFQIILYGQERLDLEPEIYKPESCTECPLCLEFPGNSSEPADIRTPVRGLKDFFYVCTHPTNRSLLKTSYDQDEKFTPPSTCPLPLEGDQDE